MTALLQVFAVLAFLGAFVLLPELVWGLLRLRRLRQGVDIGVMPFGLGYWYGLRLWAAAFGFALALIAGAIALGVTNPVVGGYVVFAIGVLAIVVLMTAYNIWRARSIARRWSRRADAENDPAHGGTR